MLNKSSSFITKACSEMYRFYVKYIDYEVLNGKYKMLEQIKNYTQRNEM